MLFSIFCHFIIVKRFVTSLIALSLITLSSIFASKRFHFLCLGERTRDLGKRHRSDLNESSNYF